MAADRVENPDVLGGGALRFVKRGDALTEHVKSGAEALRVELTRPINGLVDGGTGNVAARESLNDRTGNQGDGTSHQGSEQLHVLVHDKKNAAHAGGGGGLR